MRLFECQNCHNALHFDNTICLNCRHRVGYLQDRFEMSALEERPGGCTALADPDTPYRFCANADQDVCNWLLRADSKSPLCESCRHNRMIPDLSILENLLRWRKIELAKRVIVNTLQKLAMGPRARS